MKRIFTGTTIALVLAAVVHAQADLKKRSLPLALTKLGNNSRHVQNFRQRSIVVRYDCAARAFSRGGADTCPSQVLLIDMPFILEDHANGTDIAWI